jgi:hypothetical protein
VAPSEFWRTTPWVLGQLIDAEADEVRAAYDLALFGAWHGELFARLKKLPELRKVLDRGKPTPNVALAAKVKVVMSQFRRASA